MGSRRSFDLLPRDPSVSFPSCALAKAGLSFQTFLRFYFMCMDVLTACVPVYHMGAWYMSWPLEEALDPLRLGLQTVVI